MKNPCRLCASRPARRACPALGHGICAVCCATKRRTEIACPPDCGYLTASRTHPPAVVQRQQERDVRFLLPLLADLTETQYRLYMFAQGLVLEQLRAPGAHAAAPAPIDADVAEAVGSVAATLETAGKGIIYEHRPASIPAQRLAGDIGAAVADLAKRAGASAARLERDMAVALRRLERAAREAQRGAPDARRPEGSWIALALRIVAAQGPGEGAARTDTASTLVI